MEIHMLVQLDTENADRNITALITVLTHTPSAANPMRCQGIVYLGDGVKNLSGAGGDFQLVITVGGQTVQPSPQTITFSTAVRATVFTTDFPVPANAEVILRVKSPNIADSDVDVTAYLYDTTVAQQDIRDAMKLAPTAGAPAADSVDAHLDTIITDIALPVTLANGAHGGAVASLNFPGTVTLGPTTITNAAGTGLAISGTTHGATIVGSAGPGVEIDGTTVGLDIAASNGYGASIIGTDVGLYTEATGGGGISIYSVQTNLGEALVLDTSGGGADALWIQAGPGRIAVKINAGVAGTGISVTNGVSFANAGGSALTLSSTGGNGHGLSSTGFGTGSGIYATGGATGHGAYLFGGATSGNGLLAAGQTLGDGMTLVGVGAGEYDLNADIFGSLTGNITGNMTGNITGNLSGSVGSVTGNTPQTGDTYMIAKAGGAGDLAAIKTDTGNLVTRITATLFAGITSLGAWFRGIFRKDAMDAAAKIEVNLGGGTYDETTDSNEAISEAVASPALTQQQVRDAMKLTPTAGVPATGSVDKHLDDIETGMGTSGEHQVTIYIKESTTTAAIPGCDVDIWNGIVGVAGSKRIVRKTTDSIGRVVIWLDAGTYRVYLNDPTHTSFSIPELLTVSSSGSTTFLGDAFNPGHAPANSIRIYSWEYKADGHTPVVGATLWAWPTEEGGYTSSGGVGHREQKVSMVTDADGYWYVDVVPGMSYEFDLKSTRGKVFMRITTPTAASSIQFEDLL